MIKYYPFELHTHTRHSDGSMSPRMLIENAINRGLQGIAITDHNTDTAIQEAKKIGRELGLTIIEGIEWTTFWGHLTVLGGNSNIDWSKLSQANINQMIEKASQAGDLVNIAHPKRIGHPICAGCHFDYDIYSYQYITGFEVWSNPKPAFNKANELALEQYDELSSCGIKLACLYGDDWHDPKNNRKQYAKTYLGINGNLNAINALEAISKRRTYISTGMALDIKITDANGNDIQLGQTIKAGCIDMNFQVEIDDIYCEKYGIKPLLFIIKGTALDKECKYPIRADEVEDIKINVRNGYLRCEIEGFNGEIVKTLLLTSPIYVEDKLC